uniref:Succinate dehydrogenase assembly factor 3 n=1 Tax=Ditylum brightwellii TaxID=49249 RepID=A0A6U3QXF5_9STRA|mmetsp:Transcript_21446/g.31868  ORF Transcript_21446/g.31868 Transcript_21446/m.31868 type:complete len:138 (-) Transcript_21446:528-941(-)
MTAAKNIAALSLYRSILRAHSKHLPPEMRNLGDAYVKSEFRLHRTVNSDGQLTQFMDAWKLYLDQIQVTARAKESLNSGVLDNDRGGGTSLGGSSGESPFGFGKSLPTDIDLNDEQMSQLEKLREEAAKVGPTGLGK